MFFEKNHVTYQMKPKIKFYPIKVSPWASPECAGGMVAGNCTNPCDHHHLRQKWSQGLYQLVLFFELSVMSLIFPPFSYPSMTFGMQDRKCFVWSLHLEAVLISDGVFWKLQIWVPSEWGWEFKLLVSGYDLEQGYWDNRSCVQVVNNSDNNCPA